MLEKVLVKQKLVDIFGEGYLTETIDSSKTKALILVETKSDVALVSISDFTHLPIGDYDVFIENRFNKSGSYLKDMAKMIFFLQEDTKMNIEKIQERLLEVSNELINAKNNVNAAFVLASQSDI